MKYQNLTFAILIMVVSQLTVNAQTQTLVISEVMSCNESVIEDFFDETPDWIEIQNTSTAVINLSNFYLSDDEDDLQKWSFPTMNIQPNEYLMVFASKQDTLVNNEIHTNFKLSSSGECIFISDNNSIVDEVCFPELLCNQSYGLENQFSTNYKMFYEASAGLNNSLGSIDVPIIFSHEAGFYTESFYLNINTIPGHEIRYTIDGSEPDVNSILYEVPISLQSRIGDPNIYSEIPTSTPNQWANPLDEVFKINIIRARVFLNNIPTSRTHTKSYCIDNAGSDKYSLPVISIVAQPQDLFSDSIGIYVPGDDYDGVEGSWTGNYLIDWSKNTHVEYFNESGTLLLNQNAELEISGQSSQKRRQKSLKLKAKGNMSLKKFDYPFFDTLDDYETLVLDSPFSEYRNSMMREAIISEMSEPLDFGNLDSKPVVVFLNGEYWGLHTLLEKQNASYIKDHYDYKDDEINFIQKKAVSPHGVIEGDNVEYLALREYVTLNDLSIPANYDYITSQINIENFIDYNLFEIFLANDDWPYNNFKVWRPIDHSRKWQWLPYDFDACFIYSYYNTFQSADEEANSDLIWSVIFLKKLLENDEFKTQFLNRFQELMLNEFCYNNLAPIITKYYNLLLPEYEEHLLRWNYAADNTVDNVYDWNREVQRYYDFAYNRAERVQDIVWSRYDYDLTICPPDTSVIINTLTQMECDSYAYNDSTYIANTTIPIDTNISYLGNDSITNLELIFTDVDLSFEVDSFAIYLNEESGIVQWLDCSQNLNPIFGATSTSLIPTEDGSYAAMIQIGDCIEITECINFEVATYCNNPCYAEYDPVGVGIPDFSACITALDCAYNMAYENSCLSVNNCNLNDPCNPNSYEIYVTATGELCQECISDEVVNPSCDDPLATNFNANAVCIDNSVCEYFYTCNNPCYLEYNPTANGLSDNSLCITPLSCADSPNEMCLTYTECSATANQTSIAITGEVCIACIVTNIDEFDWKSQLNFFPNPANNEISITINSASLLNELSISIVNSTGKVFIEKSISSSNNKINIADLPSGIYFIQFINNEEHFVEKLVVN